MNGPRYALARILGFLRGGPRDADLDEEVRFHLEMLTEEYVRRGLAPDEARAAARRSFGGVMQMKESWREQRSLPWLETFIQDVRYGARALARTPGFTMAALLTLALGIGANTAIFSVVNAVLLRPLPYVDSERLVQLLWHHPTYTGANHDGRRYLFFRDHLTTVEALAATSGAGSFNLVLADRAEFVTAIGVSKEYFAVFGFHPALGQAFTAEHDAPGGPDVAILTDDLWRRQFGADPAVVGRSILLGDRSCTVVGVMPAAFDRFAGADLLLPLRPGLTGRGGGFNYTVTGRLKPGVSMAEASAEAATAWHALKSEYPQNIMRNEAPTSMAPLQESLAAPVRPALLMMLAAVGLLLLIACANTASLLLARCSARTREVAVRAALGAGRSRIVRQVLTESVLLSCAGAAAGVLLANWLVPTLLTLTPPGFALDQEVRIDFTVLIATLALAVLTGLFFGVIPAAAAARQDLVAAFKDDGGRAATGRRSARVRKALVVAEVALCMLLLIGAGLLLQTFVRLRAVDPGFNAEHVVAASMSLQGERYADPRALLRFYETGLDQIRRIPGVRAAAVTSGIPLSRALNLNVDVLDWPDNPAERVQDALTDWRYVTAGYFEAMEIPIVAGRSFNAGDTVGAPPVAIVSEEFGRRLFKGTNPIGRHIRVFDADGAMEIVGVARDLREGGPRMRTPPVMYVPVAQTHPGALKTTHTYFQVNWIVRADSPGAALTRQIEEQIRQVDPRQPFSSFRTMDEVKTAAILTERFQMTLLGVFAVIGLLLAAAGIYGLIAFSVTQRTREFGIRVALGATRAGILSVVLGEGARLAMAGVVIGAAAALGLTRLLRSFVWGVSTLDPLTFVTVGGLLLVVALSACLVPALRAVGLDPVAALRQQ